jgi:carboxypeptidase family protein
MPTSSQWRLAAIIAVTIFLASAVVQAQSISGTVLDPSGAVVPNATVEIHNPVSKYDRSISTDSSGRFSFTNVPLNPYHMKVSAPGFAPYAQDVEIRSSVPIEVPIKLQVSGTATVLTVEAGADLVENDPISHTDVDKNLFDKLPLESQSSSLSSLVTLATAGVAADSNGLFHGMGDHAENSFSARWPAYYRPAEQGFFQSGSAGLGSVAGGDSRRTPGRVWRQDQLDHQCDDALRPRHDDASW